MSSKSVVQGDNETGRIKKPIQRGDAETLRKALGVFALMI